MCASYTKVLSYIEKQNIMCVCVVYKSLIIHRKATLLCVSVCVCVCVCDKKVGYHVLPLSLCVSYTKVPSYIEKQDIMFFLYVCACAYLHGKTND